jgi:RimJ/RimL family protein N-acetyltransferase
MVACSACGRDQGYGTSVIAALLNCPQLAHISLFVAGVEPDNAGSISCLLKNGFQPLDPTPDWEGTVYYAKRKPPGLTGPGQRATRS